MSDLTKLDVFIERMKKLKNLGSHSQDLMNHKLYKMMDLCYINDTLCR